MSDTEEVKNEVLPPVKKERKSRRKYVEGEVILVDQEKLQQPLPSEVSLTKANKVLKQKRELSDKQKDNLKKLIELNRVRREESLKQREDIPDPVPEGKAVVTIKSKRTYSKQPQQVQQVQNVQNDYMEKMMERLNGIEQKLERPHQPKESKERKERPRRTRTKPEKKFVKEEEDTTELDSTELDTDKEETINKKVQNRLHQIKEIENKLQNTNSYTRSGLSIF